tara:strand:+ start:364 stop:2124 length:1761 start_codon:yes stop_codon:yes gene_type:complete
MKVSDIISNFLVSKSITKCFGIIGSANSHIYDSCLSNNVEIINVHNEQAAVMAAGAYFKTTGKLSAAIVTAGGGVTNSVTGIVSAWADSTPVLIFSGQESASFVQEHDSRRMYGTQGLDIVHMVSKNTKYAKTLMYASEVQTQLEHMYFAAVNGRPGPSLLDVPFDVQSKDVDYRIWKTIQYTTFNQDFYDFFTLIKTASRPVILAGQGVKLSNSVDLFKNFIETFKAPVMLTWSAIDLLPDSHPLYMGRPGVYGQRHANFIFQKSDVLIVLGSRLTLPQSGYDFKEIGVNTKIVMVDIDPSEFKSFAYLCYHTDCNHFLNTVQKLEFSNNEWLTECNEIKHRFPVVDEYHVDDRFPNSYKIIDKMSDYLDDDHIVVTDMGTALLSGHQAIRMKEGMTMFSSYGLGEMGYGLPAALGAAISSPDRNVLCLNCDGGMMMNLQELQTIIQHKLKVKIVIFNNDGYLMIKHTQKMLFNNSTAVDADTGIVLPDYMKVAKAFGYDRFQVKTWDDFHFHFPRFIKNDTPAICEIFMHPNQEFIPKVKGVLKSDGTIFAPPIEEMSPILPMSVIEDVMGDNISKKSSMILRN